jgi:hypothetical protein
VPRPPRPPRWGGAIAGWELTRLARRGSPTVARLLVAHRLPEDAGPHSRDEAQDAEVGSVADAWPSFVGTGTYLLLAWALYVAAGRRFEREWRG